LDLNDIEKVIIQLTVPKTMVSTLLSVIIPITETIIHISYSQNHDSTLMLVFYYFHVSLLQTHANIIAKGALNVIGYIIINLNVPKNGEFHTNVGRYYFTCISTPIPEMVWVK